VSTFFGQSFNPKKISGIVTLGVSTRAEGELSEAK